MILRISYLQWLPISAKVVGPTFDMGLHCTNNTWCRVERGCTRITQVHLGTTPWSRRYDSSCGMFNWLMSLRLSTQTFNRCSYIMLSALQIRTGKIKISQIWWSAEVREFGSKMELHNTWYWKYSIVAILLPWIWYCQPIMMGLCVVEEIRNIAGRDANDQRWGNARCSCKWSASNQGQSVV